MSRTSHFLICVMVAGLAFMAGLRVYQAYEVRAAQEDQEIPPSLTFQNVPLQLGPAPVVPSKPQFQPPTAPAKEIYLQDEPLAPVAAQEQARQTITSIMDDYRQEPKLQAFYSDLQAATGQNITLEMLSGEKLGKLMAQNPQMQGVIAKYSQDPEFVKILQEIFSNPQFAQSVSVLQGPPARPVGR